MIRVPRRGPKGLEFKPESQGRVIFGGRACPKCGMRAFTLTGEWRLIRTKSSERTFRRVQVECLECKHLWWSASPRVLALAAR